MHRLGNFAQCAYHVSGYMSLYKALNERTPTNYYPELEDEIWDGLISIDPYKPTVPEWDAFSQTVIERSEDLEWPSYTYQPQTRHHSMSMLVNSAVNLHIVLKITLDFIRKCIPFKKGSQNVGKFCLSLSVIHYEQAIRNITICVFR